MLLFIAVLLVTTVTQTVYHVTVTLTGLTAIFATSMVASVRVRNDTSARNVTCVSSNTTDSRNVMVGLVLIVLYFVL